MYGIVFVIVVVIGCLLDKNEGISSPECRDRSNTLRQDGSLCFELPSWQHKPVELNKHMQELTDRWQIEPEYAQDSAQLRSTHLIKNEVTRYMDTVLFPFLDTYHKNIQHSYQQFTQKSLKKIKDEINMAVHRKREIYDVLMALADDLNVPELCAEERRFARTLASKHVSLIFTCTEEARKSITMMGKYAEQMITITKHHMQMSLKNTTDNLEDKTLPNSQVMNSTCIAELAKLAVTLGYELDLSLTNARRHNEQTCDKLTNCCSRGKRVSDEQVQDLKNKLMQCVYA